MLLTGTLIVLILWASFVWFVDPDGFRDAGRPDADEGAGTPGRARAERRRGHS